MNELKQRIARGDYAVDAQRVAAAVVAKLSLMRSARSRLAEGARVRRGFERAR